MPKTTAVIPNQIFLGLPWKNVRPRYEKCIQKLKKRYPLHFTIVGRNDSQEAEDLLEIIKTRIESSSYAIFDATSGNANVSLEYGYAEALDLPRSIYLSRHKSASKSGGGVIIADLGGKRRVEYTTEPSLFSHLEQFCKSHNYARRFESWFNAHFARRKKEKRSMKALALKIIHVMDDRESIRRSDLVQALLAEGYRLDEVEGMVRALHTKGLIRVAQGRSSTVQIA